MFCTFISRDRIQSALEDETAFEIMVSLRGKIIITIFKGYVLKLNAYILFFTIPMLQPPQNSEIKEYKQR